MSQKKSQLTLLIPALFVYFSVPTYSAQSDVQSAAAKKDTEKKTLSSQKTGEPSSEKKSELKPVNPGEIDPKSPNGQVVSAAPVTPEVLTNLDLEAVEDESVKPEIFEPQKEKRPKELTFLEGKISVSIEEVEKKGSAQKEKRVFVTVPLFFQRENWELASTAAQDVQPYVEGKIQGLQLKIPVKNAVTPVPLALVSAKGEVEEYRFEVRFLNWEKLVHERTKKYKRFSAQAGMATSLIFFSDSRFTPTSVLALTVRGSATFLFVPPRWDVTLGGFINALPVFAGDRTSYIRFLGLNLRVGYKIPWPKSPWQLGVAAGWYYSTMIVPTGDRGFINMNGPQLYPNLTRFFENGHSLNVYAKYSPMFNGIAVMALSNFEVAAGVAYTWKLPNQHPLTAHFDFATFGITLQSVRITATSLSLGASYGF